MGDQCDMFWPYLLVQYKIDSFGVCIHGHMIRYVHTYTQGLMRLIWNLGEQGEIWAEGES